MNVYPVVNGKRLPNYIGEAIEMGNIDLSKYTFTEYWVDSPCIVCVEGAEASSGGGSLNTGGSVDPTIPPAPVDEQALHTVRVESEMWQPIPNMQDVYMWTTSASTPGTLTRGAADFDGFLANYRADLSSAHMDPANLNPDEFTVIQTAETSYIIVVRTPGGQPGAANITIYGQPR